MPENKSVVFLVSSYYPMYYANGNCVRNIAAEMANDFETTVITQRTSTNQANGNVEGSFVMYAGTFVEGLRKRVSDEIEKSGTTKGKLIKLAKSPVKKYRYLSAMVRRTSIDGRKVKSFLDELGKINFKIDAVVPTCEPFECILAALEFKKKCGYKLKVIPVLIDTFSENTALHRTEKNRKRKFNAHLVLEQRMLDESDCVIAPDSWKKHLERYFPSYDGKLFYIQYPALKKITATADNRKYYDENMINIIYTGSLYKKIRSPLYALNLLAKLIEQDKRIILHFYIRGDCTEIIDDYSWMHPGRIINHGSVSTETAGTAMMQADILLSIGNADATQFPSKIFEYISTGKPVIHFYTDNNDPVLPILERYENALSLETEKNAEKRNADAILKFLKTPHDRIPFEKVEEEFHRASPGYTAKIIKKELEA